MSGPGDDDDDDDGPDDTEAYSRDTDPSTSHEAAAKVRPTRLEAEVLGVLRESGAWLSVIQIGEEMDLHPWSVSPRLRPLFRKGLVDVRKEPRVNSEGNTANMQVWRAVRPGTQLLLFDDPPQTPHGQGAEA